MTSPRSKRLLRGASLALTIAYASPVLMANEFPSWTESERATLHTLSLSDLAPLPPDPSNRYANDPRAARLGKRLFFDRGFSSNGKVSCASCHKPKKTFQDGDTLAKGVGTTTRRTMPIAGTAYSPWLFWDGRKDSQWSQALGPLESAVEHNTTRLDCVRRLAVRYQGDYEAIFGPLPDLSGLPESAGPTGSPTARAAWNALSTERRDAVTRAFSNMGKSIAAFERSIMPGPSRFDAYVNALEQGDGRVSKTILSPKELAGLRLFIGKGHCAECHNGPLFTDNDFHNTGVPARKTLPPDLGRYAGIQKLAGDEFNCIGHYSDASPEQCMELRFMKTAGPDQIRAYKPPSLRNAARRPPFMHAGQFASLHRVLDHYNRAPPAPKGRSEVKPLHLSPVEINQLISFIRALSGPVIAPQL